MPRLTLLALAACLFAPSAFADDPPFASSRPGQTEGPIAVPSGYFQAETEIASYTHDKQAGQTDTSIRAAATEMRYGLPADFDAELVVQPYLRDSFSGPGFKDHVDGFGDVTLRVLKTLMGEDGKGPSLAVIGYVTAPTASHGLGAPAAQPGAILTGAIPLADAFGLAWTAGVEDLAEGGGHHQGEFSGALQLNHQFTEKLGGYVELAAVRDQHDTQTAATGDMGLTWLTGPTTQLDAGVNLGITRAAADASVFIGWAHRF